MGDRVDLQHRTVAGEIEFDVARGLALHRQGLVDDPHVLPAAVVAVLAGIFRVQLVDIEVFLIDREDGDAERDPVVVADGDAGLGRLAGADHRKPRRVQLHDVAQRRRTKGPVRIVGQDGAAGRGARRRDHPVVGAFRRGLGGEVGQMRRVVGGGARGRGGRKGHVLGRQDIVGQHVRRHVTWVEPGGRPQRMRRLDLAAQQICAQARRAGDPGPGHLGIDVAGQTVRAHAHHVRRGPQIGRASRQLEFHRQRRCARAHLGHIAVDAGDEGLGIALGVRPIGRPFAVHVAAIEEEARRPVLRRIGRAEACGEQPKAALAPQVDLPQPVARGVVALREKGVVHVAGEDVGYAPLVDDDVHRLVEARNGDFAMARRRRRLSRGRQGGQDCAKRQQHDPFHGRPPSVVRPAADPYRGSPGR